MGTISQDTFYFGDLAIKNQVVLDATHVEPIGISWEDLGIVHGILGLTPCSSGSQNNTPSSFMTMVSEGVLDRNIFSLRLREPREIVFGDVNPNHFVGEITRLPLTHETSPWFLTGRWQTPAHHLAIDFFPSLRLSLSGLTATFSTTDAYIRLPDPLALNLIQELGFEDIMMVPPSFRCDQLKYMPDVILNLAGHNFTLTPYDYTFDWKMESGNVRCVSAFMGFLGPSGTEIVLGSAVLRAFYSVFDLDTGTVECK